MEDFYDKMPCYLLSFSADGSITRINAHLLKHIGFSAEQVIGKMKIEQLLNVGSRIFFQTHFLPLIKMNGSAYEIFLSFVSKTGEELPVLLNVKVEEKRDAVEIHMAGMKISQRNKYEREILEARKIAEKALEENHELIETRNKLKEN